MFTTLIRTSLVLLTALLLAGCVKTSATYYINDNDHALTVRAEQEYFWDDNVTLKLVASRWPDCQRQFPMAKLPPGELEIELYASGENEFTVRAGEQAWRIETQTCTQLAQPEPGKIGERLGTFRLNADHKMVFEKV